MRHKISILTAVFLALLTLIACSNNEEPALATAVSEVVIQPTDTPTVPTEEPTGEPTVEPTEEVISQKYSSDIGEFVIQFPNNPNETEQEIDTDAGKISFHSFIAKDEEYEYAVTLIDYPMSAVQEKGSKAILDDASEGAISSVFGTLLDRNEIVVGGYSGVNQTVETVDKIFVSNMFLVENRLYLIVMTGSKEAFPHNKAQDFLSSFELLPKE
jgi:hypothetical protein